MKKNNYRIIVGISLLMKVTIGKMIALCCIANRKYKSPPEAEQKLNSSNSAWLTINFPYYLFTAFISLFLFACNSNKETDKPDMGGMRMPDKVQTRDSTQPHIPLDALLKPVNAFVISSVPVTVIQTSTQNIEVPALGNVQYDLRQAGTVSARIAGRIEKLYVRYRYQHISKGQKILEIYSPELLTSQQNLIFLFKNDAGNTSLINAARQRLLLLGMSSQQINQITNTGKPLYSVSVYSNYSGYVTDAGSANMQINSTAENGMNAGNSFTQTTEELSIKEGMYLDEGQAIFTVINTTTVLVSLNIFADQQSLIKVGDAVKITAETSAESIRSSIAYIEPFYSGETKTVSARAYINNTAAKIPVGSQVQATIFAGAKVAAWLPSGAVLSLGLNDIVFKKEGAGFRAKKVVTGIRHDNQIQIISGLAAADSVAISAQFLTESESFIQVK
jgi:Cu(I)/Ag(I) efflux system membrane fusion protein